MNEDVRRKLDRLGELVPLESGDRGVPVALQYRARLGVHPRAERRRLLEEKFRKIALGREEGVRVDLGTLSVSGQTVEGVIPLERFEEVERGLAEEDVRVDVLLPRRATL